MRELQAMGFDRALSGPATLLPIGELGVTQGPIPTIPGARSESGDYMLAADELRQRFTLTGTPSEAENWVTRYDGTFTAHPVTPGRIRALVRHPAYVEGLSDLVTLTAGGVVEVKVTLRAGGSLEGVVVDHYGRPLGGMRVELSANTGSRTVATYTADDGAFAFAALPSEVTLTVARAENPDRPVVRERVTVREGKRESVRLVVPEARDSVECLVVDERGDPIEGAEVVFASLDANSPLRQTRFTGADGRVTMDDARGLEISVTAESPGYAPTQERFGKAPERVRVVLKAGVKVTGRVTSVRGRVLVAQARVTVISQGRRRVTTTNADGVLANVRCSRWLHPTPRRRPRTSVNSSSSARWSDKRVRIVPSTWGTSIFQKREGFRASWSTLAAIPSLGHASALSFSAATHP
ncbi:MAG: carboxypeptidase-like regulatory domain-containing protein [Polyangiaceae bacterium]